MSTKVLFVDDEQHILDSYVRNLDDQFEIDTASSGHLALEMIQSNKPYAVIVADMQMPEMDGVTLLNTVDKVSPNTVKMMLTGNSDQQTAIDAVNKGHVFNFMTKPCSIENLAKNVMSGIQHYKLKTAEYEIMSKTLTQSLNILFDMLEKANPEAFSRTSRIKKYTMDIAEAIKAPGRWQFSIAAMLSQLGCVQIPAETLKKINAGMLLKVPEEEVAQKHPKIASDMISTIPRMESIAQMILYQNKFFDGTGFPMDNLSGENIPLGARILKIALDFDTLIVQGKTAALAIECLKRSRGFYDPNMVYAFERHIRTHSSDYSMNT